MTDPQDPLPESQFIWRRIFSYVVCIILLGLVAWIVNELDGNAALAQVAKWLIGLNALVITYYMVAPSAEQIARIVQAARVMQAGLLRTENTPGAQLPVEEPDTSPAKPTKRAMPEPEIE